MSTAGTVTPAMRQYLDAKRQHRDAIVLFRMGDFYEMFYEDALVAARALELTLTSRSKDAGGAGIPMCGVPYHALDGYLARLVKRGFRVAICEQVEDPKKAKGVVRREVVRVVSPGTLTDANYLEAREPAFLMALLGDTSRVGAALLDLSTGEFTAAEYCGPEGLQALADEIAVLRPREIVVPEGSEIAQAFPEIARLQLPVTAAEAWSFEQESARRTLLDQLRTHGLEGFGLDGHAAAMRAAGGLVAHLRGTQKADLAHVRAISYKALAECLLVDPITLKHLELIQGSEGGPKGSLLAEIDRTVTPMAARLLRAWLLRPLVSLERIRERLDAVEELAFRATDRGKFREALKSVQDLERLIARVALGTAGPRDLVSLRTSLAAVPRVRMILEPLQAPLVRSLVAELDDLADVRGLIEGTIVDEPPALARDGGFTRDGIDGELDELRTISRSGRQVIAEMEERERARTGIASLKVRFNRVFGYYIEISKANLHAAPADYQRKQTIAGGERFTTPALKEYEEKILGADERILERELQIYERLRQQVAAEAPRIQDTARALAALDVLAALAETAALCNFTKPHVHDGDEMIITEGRHPVVEHHAPHAFVPNDLDLDGAARQLVILTGPNMGGKSTYLRQTAIMPLLAQIGSFVPAREAKLPIVDRIFARVGASDNIARGQSTFMVEMQETANILHAASSRSLVVLDEIGRGTSTFDGLSIAWAVAEYLATNPKARPKTLFATHYHELTDLADALPGVVNAHVSAREYKDDIIFLRKIVPGRSDRSYGIQVARLAGLPSSVVARAKEILTGLERDELSRGGRPSLSDTPRQEASPQLGLFAAASDDDSEIARRLKAVDIDETTPRQAFEILAELKKLLGVLVLSALAGCAAPQAAPAGHVVVEVQSSPNNFDPRVGTDDVSQRVAQLVFSNLMTLDENLRVVPALAARLENPDPLTYIAHLRRGVRFHDGRELTAADVVYTFTSLLDPDFISPRKGAYRIVASIDAVDAYTVRFRLKEPFGSFPVQLVMPIVPAGAGAGLRSFPIGTGPYRFVRYDVDDRVVLSAFEGYYDGLPLNTGLVLKIVPDDTMRGLELRKGTVDLVINDLAPDIVHQLQEDGHLSVVTGPGTDYQYIGFNMRDPILSDKRVRHAISYAVDRQAIVDYLRRGQAQVAIGMLPPVSWAFEPGVRVFAQDLARAKGLLDDAGYPDPDGNGPLARLSLSLKISTNEFSRLQAAVIQQDLRAIGIDLDVRSYEFATLYADVLKGNFQMYTLQWVGGAVADPDILRRVFHSQQVPPAGFNRGYYSNPEVDRALEAASRATGEAERKRLYGEAQRLIAEDAPYVSLWNKTNVAVMQPGITGLRLMPTGDFTVLKDVRKDRREETRSFTP